MNRLREDELKKIKAIKKLNNDFNSIPSMVSSIKKAAVINKSKTAKMHADIKTELEIQKNEGVIKFPKRHGRIKYIMRKTDFQNEEDLTGSLRGMKPV